VIKSLKEAEQIKAQLLDSASKTAAWLRQCDDEAIHLLRKLRFDPVGFCPSTGKALNIVEQLNQTFTILVSLSAIEYLLTTHPDVGGFKLALGTSSGRDNESVQPDRVIAEVFSATHPTSNQKLKKDVDRLTKETAAHKYVFFAAPKFMPGRHANLERPGVDVKVFAVDPFCGQAPR